MPSLPKGFKADPDKSFILNYAPIFAEVSPTQKDLIIQKSKVIDYHKGDIIYRQQDAADAFYCVISGRVKIFTFDKGHVQTLEYLSCGEYFGIISLLIGEPHSVNAEAVYDSKILRIAKEDFHIILSKIPKLAIDLSRALSRRLRKKDLTEKKIFESNIISVLSIPSGTSGTIYATNLGISLNRETHKKVILLNITDSPIHELSVPSPNEQAIENAIFKDLTLKLDILELRHNPKNSIYPTSLNGLLAHLTGNYHYIIVNLTVEVDSVVFQIFNQSDIIYVITNPDAHSIEMTKTLILDLSQQVNYTQDKIRIIVNTVSEDISLPHKEVSKVLNYKIYATLPLSGKPDEKDYSLLSKLVVERPDSEYARAVRRIARETGGACVGLALSGGAAFALAHIGVIKILENEKIPIDMVVGSSMGAFIGVLWAIGLNSRQIEEIALEFNNKKKKVFHLLLDLCFPKLAFAKGRRIRGFLEKHIGNKTFQDIKLPFKIVACNLSKRQEVIYDSGRLVDAIMASIAIPGIFEPTRAGSDLIVDGGIIQPVPIGVLVKCGIRKIIAVNVLPSPENISQGYELTQRRLEAEKKEAQARGFFPNLIYNLQLWFQRIFFPNILDVIVNSIQTTEYVIAEADCQRADVVIRPVVAAVDWFEFFKTEILIKRGEEETTNCLSLIKNLVNE